MNLKSIDQRGIIIRDAPSGIGRKTALQFAKRGAKLVVAAQNETNLGTLIEKIARLDGTATSVVADTSSLRWRFHPLSTS